MFESDLPFEQRIRRAQIQRRLEIDLAADFAAPERNDRAYAYHTTAARRLSSLPFRLTEIAAAAAAFFHERKPRG